MPYLTRKKIKPGLFLEQTLDFKAGASVFFLGRIRGHSSGKEVAYLEYTAYEALAETRIADLISEAAGRWGVLDSRVLHRLGRLDLGEIAVMIEVRSGHREEAYQTSRFLIEGIKHQVPIWKKEYFKDGTSAWGGCRHEDSAYVGI